MQYVCTIHSTGGPIAILPRDCLPLWDGDEDYLRAIHEPMNGSSAFLFAFKNACTVCIFQHSADENFHIYHDRDRFAVLSEIYAEPGYELDRGLPDLERSIAGRPSVLLESFGGVIALFNAAFPGDAVRLSEVGCGCIDYGGNDDRMNAALLDVRRGTWEAVDLYWRGTNLAFTGVLFGRLASGES